MIETLSCKSVLHTKPSRMSQRTLTPLSQSTQRTAIIVDTRTENETEPQGTLRFGDSSESMQKQQLQLAFDANNQLKVSKYDLLLKQQQQPDSPRSVQGFETEPSAQKSYSETSKKVASTQRKLRSQQRKKQESNLSFG